MEDIERRSPQSAPKITIIYAATKRKQHDRSVAELEAREAFSFTNTSPRPGAGG